MDIPPECLRSLAQSLMLPARACLPSHVDVLLAAGERLANSPSTQHRERLEQLPVRIGFFMRGQELGPLSRPIIDKADDSVVYVDRATKADLCAK